MFKNLIKQPLFVVFVVFLASSTFLFFPHIYASHNIDVDLGNSQSGSELGVMYNCNTTSTSLGIGSSCAYNGQCSSGFCGGVAGSGCGTCSFEVTAGLCPGLKLPTGSDCAFGSQCLSGICDGGQGFDCTSGACSAILIVDDGVEIDPEDPGDPPDQCVFGPDGYNPVGTLGGPCGSGGTCGAGMFCQMGGTIPSYCGPGFCMSDNYGGGGSSYCATSELNIPDPPTSIDVDFPAFKEVDVTIPPANGSIENSPNGTGDYHRVRVVPAGEDIATSSVLALQTKPRNKIFTPPQPPNVVNLTMTGAEEIDYVSPVKVGVQNCNDCTGWCGPWIEMDNLLPHPAPACFGDTFNNATLCPDDSTGLETDLPYSLVSTCSTPSSVTQKCEYVCNAGFIIDDETGLCESIAPNVFGWAWSSNVGWIKMNHCDDGQLFTPTSVPNGVADPGSCETIPYGVKIKNEVGGVPVSGGPGKMKGYVWNNNIGWIKFGGLSGFPVGLGSTQDNAKLESDGTTFTGWIKTVIGGLTPGFDGWASLSGQKYESPNPSGGKGVTYVPSLGRIVGNAWGGNVLGWIDFLYVTYGEATADFDYKLIPTGTLTTDIGLGATQNVVTVSRVLLDGNPQDVTLVAELEQAPSGASGVSISIGNATAVPGTEAPPCAPECASDISVVTTIGAVSGTYEFVIKGKNPNTPDKVGPTIIVNVSPAGPTDVSCDIDGDKRNYVNNPVTWVATSLAGGDPLEDSYVWEGTSVPETAPSSNTEITKTYFTTGNKYMSVSLNGGPMTPCERYATISVEPNTKEI